jgi:IrrE N-terminal-like domain
LALALEEIERRAEGVLSRVPSHVWDGESLPVPVEHIADSCFGLLVRDMTDMLAAPGAPDLGPGHGLSGLLLPFRGEIWVNADEATRWPGRRRFTICHELGHWCMHCQDGEAVFCRTGTVEPADTSGEVPTIEEEAQLFAAAMLIPAQLLRREYGHDRDFDRLCLRFATSRAAMGRRLHVVI